MNGSEPGPIHCGEGFGPKQYGGEQTGVLHYGGETVDTVGESQQKDDKTENTEKSGGSRWDSKVDFFMAAISSTVGLGNLWRFPYICYRNGGGAFLIPFILMIVFVGFPLVTMELALGQFSRKGPIGVWNLCPIFEGIGWAMVIMNFVCTTYYVMLMAYSLYFLFASFASVLPWTTCNNSWNTAACLESASGCLRSSGTWLNETCQPDDGQGGVTLSAARFSTEEYFHDKVLGLSGGDLNDLGRVQWPLALCLLLAWVFIILGLSLGTRSWGKVSYVTALLPYAVMLALLIRAVLMPGAREGILYFILPHWGRLADGRVWGDAAIQVFFSVGCGWGNFITIGRHNRFRDNPIVDAGVLVLGDFFTSLFCGFVVFAILGGMSYQMNVSVADVLASGPSLAYVIYPQAVTMLPFPQIWSVLFFLMLTNLGLGSAMPQLANILDLTEKFPVLRTKRNRLLTLIIISALCFLFGLVYTTNGGMYVLTLVDTYGPSVVLLFLGLFEVLVVSWVYGSGRLLRDISTMTGWRLCHFFTVFWRGICPVAIFCVLISMLVRWGNVCLANMCLPAWANSVGWCLTFGQLLVIPIMVIVKLVLGMLRKQGIRQLLRPTKEWGVEECKQQDMSIIYPTTETLISKV